MGSNPDAAKYAGINVKRTIILTMALSGALAGMAGAIEVTGLNYRHELGFSVGYGFDAIAIALLGKTHPFGVVLGAILFAGMRNGATRMQFLTQIPVDVISVIQALILLFVAADAIIRYIYRIRAQRRTSRADTWMGRLDMDWRRFGFMLAGHRIAFRCGCYDWQRSESTHWSSSPVCWQPPSRLPPR